MQEKFRRQAAYQNVISMLQEIKNPNNLFPEIFQSFMGFGGLKELLLPLEDQSQWNKTDLQSEQHVKVVHQLLQEIFGPKYDEAVSSIKSSVLSSFFTPAALCDAVVQGLVVSEEQFKTILEPSAGTGKFIEALKRASRESSITAIEKDLVTSKFLMASQPDVETLHSGFEQFKNRQFDLVISNIPFGSFGVFDDVMFREANPAKIKATTRIHNYFFVKALDNLKPGGLLAFITSAGVMDSKGNKEIREYLMRNSDLIDAYRLPNTTFQSAGTFPLTDLIVLRKVSGKKKVTVKDELLFIDTEGMSVKNEAGELKPVEINRYFKNHPEKTFGVFIADGQYGRESLDMIESPELPSDVWLQRITTGLAASIKAKPYLELTTENIVTSGSDSGSEEIIPPSIKDYESLKAGNLVVVKGRVGVVSIKDSQKIFRHEKAIKSTEHAIFFIEIRNVYNKLIQAEFDSDHGEMTSLRSRLNDLYDVFVFRYGNLHAALNKKLFLFDAEGVKVLSLERIVAGQPVKADILSQQINNVELNKSAVRVNSVKDAMLVSLNAKNWIDIDFMAEIMETPRESVVEAGASEGLFFRDLNIPDKQHYITKDNFLSGNVVERLDSWEQARSARPAGVTLDEIERNIELLKNSQPVFLKRELIDLNIGERWVPLDIYEQFVEHLLKSPATIKYIESNDQYLISLHERTNENTITLAANTYSGVILGSKIVEYAMADTQPYLTKPDPMIEDRRIPDVDGMKNVELRIKEVKDAYERFLSERKDISERIEILYNKRVNNRVKRQYDGSHLTFPGLDKITPREHQKNATWMLLQQDGGIVDHKVGAGKTLVIVMTAMEMRRLGIARKPLILCLKANVTSVAETFRQAYPDAKLLAPEAKDYKPEKRKALFASIAANDWDAVILTHDQFLAIPQSDEIQREIFQQEFENLRDDLNALEGDKEMSKRVLKGLEKRKENLGVRLKSLAASIERDENVLDFDKMGFDHIMVDESQEFKNLHFTTRHQQVAGLGSPEGSQRAMNMEFAIRTIQKKKGGDCGVTFLSGTTISNSLVELYLLFKYLRPGALKELQINSFDAWAKMYARKSATYEFTVTNELKMKERYREFIKVPELAMFYAEITDYVGDAQLKIDRPSLEHVVVNIEPTLNQQEYTQKLINFTKTRNPSYVGLSLSESELSAYMLIATNLAKKMSNDMRLIDPLAYEFEDGSKVDILCKTVASEFEDSRDYRGTQLIFADIGTPGGTGFNLYAEIKRILVSRHGIPANEIEFIHDFETETKKEDLFKRVRNGLVRIMLGSSKKMGTGVNVQDRIIAMHHLDTPWTPKDFEQRGGRGGRQGNWAAKEHRNNIVKNYVYAVNRTLDGYQFNILANKQKFISQIKNNSIDQRRIDEGSFDQEGGMNFAEYVALLSGNTDLLEKVKLEKKLADLERGYSVYLKRKTQAQHRISQNGKSLKVQEDSLMKLTQDGEALASVNVEELPITIKKQNYEEKKDAGSVLLKMVETMKGESRASNQVAPSIEVGNVLDFKLMVKEMSEFNINKGVWEKRASFSVTGGSGMVYNYADGRLNENPALAGRYILDSIKRIPRLIENTNAEIERLRSENVAFEKELQAEFNDKDLILELKSKIEKLTIAIEGQLKSEGEKNAVPEQVVDQVAQDHDRQKQKEEIIKKQLRPKMKM